MTHRQLDSPDDRLIEAARSSDRSALDRLLHRHYNRIWGLCRRLAGNDVDAQDAAQEALIAIARGLHGFDGRAAFTTWSYRVVDYHEIGVILGIPPGTVRSRIARGRARLASYLDTSGNRQPATERPFRRP